MPKRVGGRECGGQSLTFSEVEGTYWGDRNILKLIYCDAYTTCKFTKKKIELCTCSGWIYDI